MRQKEPKDKRRLSVSKRGFTLIEVIISVLLISIILMIVLPVFMSIMETKSRLESGGIRQRREAIALMNIMQSDLKSAFISKRESGDKFMLVNSKDLDGNSVDEVYFTSFSLTPVFTPDGRAYSDQQEVAYFIKDEDDRKVLYRRTSNMPDDDLLEGGAEVKLTDSITYLDLVVYGGSFLSEDDFGEDVEEPVVTSFPSGLLIKFGLRADDGTISDYESAVILPPYIYAAGKEVGGQEGGTEAGDQGSGKEGADDEVNKNDGDKKAEDEKKVE